MLTAMIILLLLLLSVGFIILATTRLHLHPFLTLLFAAIGFGLLSGMPLERIIEAITDGFGGTLGAIGIVIVAGTIIGTFLEKSGGAYAMAEAILKRIGRKRVPLAMSFIGWVVSIPVFADSGFVILASLNKALSEKAKISLSTSVVALAMGLAASHTMVPPTPGPIAAAGILDVDLGSVIMLGIPVSLMAMMVGVVFANVYASSVYIAPNPDVDEAIIQARLKKAPSAAKSFLPILIPIILIVLKSMSELPSEPFGTGFFSTFIEFVGHPFIALLIGILIAFTLPKKFDKEMLSQSGWVGQGLLDAAVIILITGAGGAFGKTLQYSGMADTIGTLFEGVNIGIWLPFILAAAIKTAQGSSTVALITTASIIAPLAATLGLVDPIDKTLAVLAIGAGSLVVSHANDSMFWIVTQMSDMDVKTGYRLHTFATLVVGLSAAIMIWLLSLIL